MANYVVLNITNKHLLFVYLIVYSSCCSINKNTIRANFSRSDAVFMGKPYSKRIILLNEIPGLQNAPFRMVENNFYVISAFKGVKKSDTVKVITTTLGSEHSMGFILNKKYKIFGRFKTGLYENGVPLNTLIFTDLGFYSYNKKYKKCFGKVKHFLYYNKMP